VHVERYGQLSEEKWLHYVENKKLIGATDAVENKIFFQLTSHDAKEFRTEFADDPPTETRYEPLLVTSQTPFFDLLRGHKNPDIQAFINKYLVPWRDKFENIRMEMEGKQLERMAVLDQVGVSRIEERISGLAGTAMGQYQSLSSASGGLQELQQLTFYMIFLHRTDCDLREATRKLNLFLSRSWKERPD
jgi:hypothetical protein